MDNNKRKLLVKHSPNKSIYFNVNDELRNASNGTDYDMLAQQEDNSLIFQLQPFHAKVQKIFKKYKLTHMTSEAEILLSRAVEQHLLRILAAIIKISNLRRTDFHHAKAYAKPFQLRITSYPKSEIIKIREQAKPEWEKREEDVQKKKNNEEMMREEAEAAEERKAISARVPIGSDDWMEEFKKISEQATKNRGWQDLKIRYNEHKLRKQKETHMEIDDNDEIKKSKSSNGGVCKGLPKSGSFYSRNISVKDVISFMERDIYYTKSVLLFVLYEHDARLKLKALQRRGVKRIRSRA